MIVAAFLFFLALFAGVGLASHRRARGDRRDYLIASHDTPPWLVGLSAVATNNSGYMFIGIIGYTYAVGLPSIWLMVGWIVGDLAASSVIHRRLRVETDGTRADTFAGILSRWDGSDFRHYRRLAALVSLVFLGTYAAAQLTAGSKALHVLFGWDPSVGALIGAAIVVAYCWAGGIRASIWTDAAQSFVMLGAMALLFAVAVASLGGPSAAWSALDAVSPTYMELLPSGLGLGDTWGPALFIVGWLFAGFSVAGQPHIMVRFMSLDSAEHTDRARAWYYGWFVLFYFLANGVGLLARVVLPGDVPFDAELALPMMALDLLPDPLVGLMLAGVFAASMSTADSLILSCAANLTEDFVPRKKVPLFAVKGATVLVTLLALGIALHGDQSVFTLVIGSWAVMAAAFVPLLTVLALGARPSEPLAISMLVAGVAVVYAWKAVPVLADYYEGMLAILAGFLVFGLGRAMGAARRRGGARG
ncbi:MAG: sodium/proline symporter [Myxococcota bacterium]